MTAVDLRVDIDLESPHHVRSALFGTLPPRPRRSLAPGQRNRIKLRRMRYLARAVVATALLAPMGCLKPPAESSNGAVSPERLPSSSGSGDVKNADLAPHEAMIELDAWTAVTRMSPGI